MLLAVGAVLLAAAALAGPHQPGQPPASAAPANPQIRQEIVDRQPWLIDAAVARIAESSAPGAQVYFLGFAGFGDERVFAEEIALAEQRVAQRYDAAARSLRLVNDRRDLEKYPFATVASLRYALNALGRVMDEEDVLFLALSSHGSEDATVAISNPGMRSDDLSATALAEALDHAGIRWRVIVISACYSGSFIDTLADHRTIVLSAAARDRPSFGCSDDRHLTYFGEGFYRDALPTARSLRDAFEATRSEIVKREKKARVRPSRPQSYFGPLMESKLAQLEAVRYSSSVVPIR
ncbi:MAG TPA: C13 family peptidase [Steroidobacteraceae bacterium]|nr:C13 family peptidase [Steroidobacteraceae bacterium]